MHGSHLYTGTENSWRGGNYLIPQECEVLKWQLQNVVESIYSLLPEKAPFSFSQSLCRNVYFLLGNSWHFKSILKRKLNCIDGIEAFLIEFVSRAPLKFSSAVLCLLSSVSETWKSFQRMYGGIIHDWWHSTGKSWAISNCDFIVVNSILNFFMKICGGRCKLSHWSPRAEDLKKVFGTKSLGIRRIVKNIQYF